MIGSWIRRTGFWALDILKGGTVREHLEDIRGTMAALNIRAPFEDAPGSGFVGAGVGEEQIELTGDDSAGAAFCHGDVAADQTLCLVDIKQQVSLCQLMRHARVTTPFYMDLDVIDNDLNQPVNQEILEQFPVINRFNFKSDYDSFQSRLYLNSPVHYMSTGGSTGAPLTVRQDMSKRKRVLAAIIYFNEIADHLLGDRLLYLRVWDEKYKKPSYQYFKENMLPIDISWPDEAIDLTLKALHKDKEIVSLLGYGVTFQGLAKTLLSQDVEPSMFHLKNLFNTSERMNMDTKEVLKNTLGCRIYDRYSNQENGIIAQTKNFSDLFIVNSADYYVELLDLEEDKPAAPGQLARIVITDLYNYAMPMIRYDTGDTAVKVGSPRGGHQPWFYSIQGRRTEILYDVEGKLLTPATLDFSIWKFGKMKQFQLIQEGAFDYRVRINGSRDIYPHGDIISEFRKFLGRDANIALEFIDEIPVAASGKFRSTISYYHYDERNYHV